MLRHLETKELGYHCLFILEGETLDMWFTFKTCYLPKTIFFLGKIMIVSLLFLKTKLAEQY